MLISPIVKPKKIILTYSTSNTIALTPHWPIKIKKLDGDASKIQLGFRCSHEKAEGNHAD